MADNFEGMIMWVFHTVIVHRLDLQINLVNATLTFLSQRCDETIQQDVQEGFRRGRGH